MNRYWCSIFVLCLAAGCATAPPPPATSPTSPASPIASSVTITIDSTGFSPKTTTVKTGDQITFLNKDTVPHDVTTEGWGIQIDSIPPGGSVVKETTSLNPETYHYHCSGHPDMTGVLIVAK